MASKMMSLSSTLTPEILDRIAALRFPPSATKSDQVLSEARKWSHQLPPDVETELRELVLPILHRIGSTYGPDPKELLRLLVSPLLPYSQSLTSAISTTPILPPRSAPSFISRAMALVFLLDQCPRMYLTAGADARWVAHFFDHVSQEFVWRVLLCVEAPMNAPSLTPLDSFERYERVWYNAGYTYEQYLLMSALIFTAADHSEDIRRHTILRAIGIRRRADILRRAGVEDPFSAADAEDVYEFSRWFRAGLPGFNSVEEFAYLRCAVIDVHWPIVKKFGRYPFRNAALGRESTVEEVSFLEESGRFGEVNAHAKERIKADVEAGRWTPLGEGERSIK